VVVIMGATAMFRNGGTAMNHGSLLARRFVWLLCGVTFVMFVAGFILNVHGDFENPDRRPLDLISLLIAFMLFATTGALIVSRRPGNVIGWIFCAIGIGTATTFLGPSYARYALSSNPGSLPAGTYVLWIQSWVWMVNLGLFAGFPLVFPTGRLLSRRWRVAAVIAILGPAFTSCAAAFTPGRLDSEFLVTNPFGISSAESFLGWVDLVGVVFFFTTVVLSIASIVLRYRRSHGVERQQMKWFLLAVACAPALVIMDELAGNVTGEVGFAIALGMLPAAVGIAILRYRLYEIDRIVSRTIAYALLSASLVLVYVIGVFGIGDLVRDWTGTAGRSQLIVAGTTLLVAALFRPLRDRIQTVVDRRFNRPRYDAIATLDGFNARLQNQIDLDALSLELRAVISETMQPAHVSVWLRPRVPPVSVS
jgi:hypothetical protein